MNSGSSELNVGPSTKPINQQREQPRHLGSGPWLRTGEGVARASRFHKERGVAGKVGQKVGGGARRDSAS